jgi:predicted DsbA family dithiol-disulfide isomerase
MAGNAPHVEQPERAAQLLEDDTLLQQLPPHPSEAVEETTSLPQVQITYYTDPLCSWSWAFEPQWRRLRYLFGEQLQWAYCMGGMIADWQQYSDPLNDVSRPVQMGPQWFQVRTLSGMPIEERIWFEDPPGSSYPACIAVKAAERQGARQGELYLRRVREAVMVERRNVARGEVLTTIAEEVAHVDSEFDLHRFQLDLETQVSAEAFRQDLQQTRYREIGRFPALAITTAAGQGVLLIGYRPYAALYNALMHVAPTLQPVRQERTIAAYVAFWERVTVREIAEAFELGIEDATQVVKAEVAKGSLSQTGLFFSVTQRSDKQNG